MKIKNIVYPCITLLLFFVMYPLLGKIFNRSHKLYDEEREVDLHYKIIDIVVDSVNKSSNFLVFDNHKMYKPKFTYGLWMDARIGDSIVKRKGELRYFFYRGASPQKVDTLTYKVDTISWKYVTVRSYLNPDIDYR